MVTWLCVGVNFLRWADVFEQSKQVGFLERVIRRGYDKKGEKAKEGSFDG